MTVIPHYYASIASMGAAIRAGDVSPVELTQTMLKRISELDPELKSYLTVTPELALQQATVAEAELRAGRDRGPLHGIPIGIKDLAYTKGIPTSAGMAIHTKFVPDHDATVVSRLATTGSILLGKLHMTEGATLEHHPALPAPTNPWRADLWTGVSSSGSGVATASGLCFASLGSDTGGSIRFPSACNGLTGVKPTWGRVSRYGICDLAASYDTIGPMTRSAEDCAAVLAAIAGFDANDMTSLRAPVSDYLSALKGVDGLRGKKIGVDWSYIAKGVTSDVRALTESAAAVMADLGAEIVPISFPDPTKLFVHLLDSIQAELAVAHRATFPSQSDAYGPDLRGMIDSAYAADPLSVAKALIERDIFAGQLREAFIGLDMILMGVLAKGTPTWDEVRDQVVHDFGGFMRFTALFNATGSPTVTAPCGFTPDGRPVGFQLVGKHCDEATLLTAAHAYQQATDWHLKRPIG